MTRLVMLNFANGTITAWAKVPGGPVHRLAKLGPFASMREVVYEPAVIEKFRLNPTNKPEKEDGQTGPLVA